MTGKKGAERLNAIIVSLTIVAVAISIFISAASDADAKNRYLADFYAHDLALIIEAVQAVPGDITIRYPLQEGFEATLEQDTLTITHTQSDVQQAQPYHIHDAMAITKGTAETVVHLTKRDNTISFDRQASALATGQQCPPLPQKGQAFTINAQTGLSLSTAPFTRQELDAMTDVLATHLKNEGLTGNQGGYFTLKLSSEQPSAGGTIIFRRPKAQGDAEQTYQHLYCTLKQGLQGTTATLKEDVTGTPPSTGYEAELVLSQTPQQTDQWDQATFLESIPDPWSHLAPQQGGEEP